MLVKKIDPDWFPAENKNLQVGEYVDISDPRDLILSRTVVGIVDGLEVSPFETYGVMADWELEEFKEFVQYKRIKQLKEQQEKLQVESNSLKDQLSETVEDPKAKRLKALEKAREARMAKKQSV